MLALGLPLELGQKMELAPGPTLRLGSGMGVKLKLRLMSMLMSRPVLGMQLRLVYSRDSCYSRCLRYSWNYSWG